MANESKYQDIIATTLENIRSMVDANTIVGTPINTPQGTTIIPISKISMGFASGGLDFSAKSKSDAGKNFGGGGGTGLNIVPVGFLAVSPNGSVEMINVGMATQEDTLDKISNYLDRAPEIIEKVKAIFKKDKSDEDDELSEEEIAAILDGAEAEADITK